VSEDKPAGVTYALEKFCAGGVAGGNCWPHFVFLMSLTNPVLHVAAVGKTITAPIDRVMVMRQEKNSLAP
jgi:hypothetical protein